MKKKKYNAPIRVYGVKFANIREVIHYALQGEPKDGVYVGEDSERYPCFDSEDYATENRFYWNFVFATSKRELDEKMEKLKGMTPLEMDYNKLTEDMAPMAYWGGDSCYEVVLTDSPYSRNGL